jgi:hypothetical protein
MEHQRPKNTLQRFEKSVFIKNYEFQICQKWLITFLTRTNKFRAIPALKMDGLILKPQSEKTNAIV